MTKSFRASLALGLFAIVSLSGCGDNTPLPEAPKATGPAAPVVPTPSPTKASKEAGSTTQEM